MGHLSGIFTSRPLLYSTTEGQVTTIRSPGTTEDPGHESTTDICYSTSETGAIIIYSPMASKKGVAQIMTEVIDGTHNGGRR
jgi:hypothetical protein